jgi:predicted nucleic acid-binding protein
MKIVFDSFAIIALFREEPGHRIVSDTLAAISVNEMQGFMSVANAGEIFYMTSRKQGYKQAQIAIESLMKFPIEFVTADLLLSIEAAKLKAKYKFSYADAFAAALTITHKATLITGDKEFKQLVGEPHFKVRFI